MMKCVVTDRRHTTSVNPGTRSFAPGVAAALPKPVVAAGNLRARFRGFVFCSLLIGVCFAKPIADLVRFAVRSDLFSHVLLIPFISAYFVWRRRAELCGANARGSFWAVVPATLSVGLLFFDRFVARPGSHLPANDHLFLTTTAFLGLLLAAALAWLGTGIVGRQWFPLAFLSFMVPWPTAAVDAVEVFLQHASAEAASLFLGLSGDPVLRDGLAFKLPGISIQVGQECSGVHSSLVLLITSIVAGQLFFRTHWRRWVLALAVVPLGILRNGFRIFTISMLCVHLSPDMISSPIHRRGGPIFFVLSLVPFFALLLWLRKTEED